jgi:hypothetical protein
MEYIIYERSRRQFYTGRGWSEEYPDAKLYSSLMAALKARRALTEEMAQSCVITQASNDGTTNQTDQEPVVRSLR